MEDILIEEVRKYECLYSIHSRAYRDRGKRQEAWEDIGKKLNKNWQDCRDAWAKLRNAYTNALKRRNTNAGQQATKRFMKWKYDDEMSFLSSHIETKTSQNRFESQYEDSLEYEISEDNLNVTDDLQVEDKKNINIIDPHPSINIYSKPVLETSKDLMKYSSSLRSHNVGPSDETLVIQNNTSANEIDLFFSSLAMTVKRLPEHEQVRLKMSISNLVFETEMKYANSTAQLQGCSKDLE